MVKPSTTELRQLASESTDHRGWLTARGLAETLPLSEEPYTGLILSALLNPTTARQVLVALLDVDPDDPSAGPTPGCSVDAVTCGVTVDLHAQYQAGAGVVPVLIEHKRFTSPSNAPGYRRNPDAAWQTDVACGRLIEQFGRVDQAWLIVLDACGRSMDTIFPFGEHNALWHVTSYRSFGARLRDDYDLSLRHDERLTALEPLLTALYAGLSGPKPVRF